MYLYKYIFLQIIKSIFIILVILNSVQASNIKNSATILMYHKFGVAKYPSTSVTIDQLKDHIKELKKDKYKILPISYIIDTIINDGDLPNNTIGISIDDADRSFLKLVGRYLKKIIYLLLYLLQLEQSPIIIKII